MGIASDFVLIVVAGLLGGILARLCRLPLLAGYIVAGIFVGPYTAGPTVGQIHDLELLAEIGVALLLFSLGLEISFRDLKRVSRVAVLGGSLQILLTTAAGTLAANTFLGMPVTQAIWFGAMISVSSTMVVLKTLSASGMTSTLASQVMIGLLVMQDLAVIPMLIILPQLGGLDSILPNLLRSIGIAAVVLATVYLLGTRLLPRVLRGVLRWGSRELFLVAVVAIGVGIGYAMHAVGLSFALGAFVAGIVLSESEFSHQALADVVPLRDIFGLLFFVTVGMLFDPRYVLANAASIIATVAIIFIGKAAIIGGSTRAFGYGNHAPWIVGFGLSQVGEFSFVLARTGFKAELLSKSTYDFALSCTVLTMVLSPLMSGSALPLARLWRRWRSVDSAVKPVPAVAHELTNHVIVAGYGRSGRAVARALRQANLPFLIVELSHELFGDLTHAGYDGIWGDISREEVQHAARLSHARLLVLTIPDPNTNHLAVERAHHANPNLRIIARAQRERHVSVLQSLGVQAVVQPEFEGGLEMARQALLECNHQEGPAATIVKSLRASMYSRDDNGDAARANA